MTYPPPPGPGGSPPSDPFQPSDPYQTSDPYQASDPYQVSNPYQPPPQQQYPPPQAYQPPQAYVPEYGYGSPYAQPPYPMAPAPQQTDGMAIASLVVSCVSVMGLCTWGLGAVIGLVGAILGHVAKRRIRQTGAGGSGMALAGVIIGWSVFAIGLIIAAVLIFTVIYAETTNPGSY